MNKDHGLDDQSTDYTDYTDLHIMIPCNLFNPRNL